MSAPLYAEDLAGAARALLVVLVLFGVGLSAEQVAGIVGAVEAVGYVLVRRRRNAEAAQP